MRGLRGTGVEGGGDGATAASGDATARGDATASAAVDDGDADDNESMFIADVADVAGSDGDTVGSSGVVSAGSAGGVGGMGGSNRGEDTTGGGNG